MITFVSYVGHVQVIHLVIFVIFAVLVSSIEVPHVSLLSQECRVRLITLGRRAVILCALTHVHRRFTPFTAMFRPTAPVYTYINKPS